MGSQHGLEAHTGPWASVAVGDWISVCVCATEKCSHAALLNERAGQPLNGH